MLALIALDVSVAVAAGTPLRSEPEDSSGAWIPCLVFVLTASHVTLLLLLQAPPYVWSLKTVVWHTTLLH